jgi:hypothetical protein
MNSVIDVIRTSETQADRPRSAPGPESDYRIYASNLKRAARFGRLLGSVSFYVPSLELHLWCRWERDERGNERIAMPRLEVEAPDGKRHRKTLVRFATAEAERRFQSEALRALHRLLASSR